ncbi:MAG TPA: O-antigen ligase family protein [Vicinamibacteria bacterium]|nr:O-antigen ligase family protein [Vicinamibacteria bacterium]
MRLQRLQLWLLAGVAATAPVSIFASEILLALAAGAFVLRLSRRLARLPATAVDTPLVAFAVWSLLSACFAASPAVSHADSKKLLLLALFYVALETLTDAEAREAVLHSVLLGGLALAALMVLQHHLLGFDRLNHRPPGFLGHYMSASGVTMVVLVVAAARLLFAPPPSPRLRDFRVPGLVMVAVAVVAAFDAAGPGLWPTRLFVAGLAVLAGHLSLHPGERAAAARAALPLLVVPLASWALVVSQTRGAWLGAVVGLCAVAALRAPRLLLVVAAAVLALLLAHPKELAGRLTVADASSLDRYYMWQAGIDMIIDRPVFGQGPGMILTRYPSYRWPEAPNPRAPHLHNNLLQVAAERGLPGFVFFAWWAVTVAATALAAARAARGERGASAAAAVGSLGMLAAIFAAGLFEYNLGDSEVLLLVLLLQAVPFAVARARPAGAPA